MARYVRFATDADQRFRALRPDALRRLVADRIAAIATVPSPSDADDFRLVAWGNTPNTGLILSLVLYGSYAVLIVYRIRSQTDEIWIQDIIDVRGE